MSTRYLRRLHVPPICWGLAVLMVILSTSQPVMAVGFAQARAGANCSTPFGPNVNDHFNFRPEPIPNVNCISTDQFGEASGRAKAVYDFVAGDAFITAGNILGEGSARLFADEENRILNANFSMFAEVQYGYSIELLKPTPIEVTAVPIQIDAEGGGLVGGSFGGIYSGWDVSFGVNGPGVSFSAQAGAGQGRSALSPSYAVAQTNNFQIGQIYTVQLSGLCEARASTTFATGGQFFLETATCSVFANSPTFTFDQAAFDAMMGADTFPLAEFFAFEGSPNLSAVPEPGSCLLLASGLAGLAGWRRRRAQEAAAPVGTEG